MKLAIIAGTGFYDLLSNPLEMTIETVFGNVTVYAGNYHNKTLYFLPRHGNQHNVLAHQINFRANMLAMKKLAVTHILAMVAVGSLQQQINKGDLVLLDQFVDFTTNRVKSYSSHSVDVSEPYCPELRALFIQAAEQCDIALQPKGCYITSDGPRYETKAEIALFKNAYQGDVVGMTNGTEAALARELGLHYAAVAIATNSCNGGDDPDLNSHKNVVLANKEKVNRLFLKAIELYQPQATTCRCHQIYLSALAARKLTDPIIDSLKP